MIAEVHLQVEVVGPLVEEEVVSLPIQDNQAETLGNKVWMQSSQYFVNLDYNEEKDVGEERIQGIIEELSLLKIASPSFWKLLWKVASPSRIFCVRFFYMKWISPWTDIQILLLT